MPSPVAAVVTCALILVLLKRESTICRHCDRSLWLPAIWLWIVGSRPLSQWIDLGSSSEEGTLIDVFFFSAVIISGLHVLGRRKLSVRAFVGANLWLGLFLVYGLVSISWSDDPFVAFKRWFKTLGHPIMALIILTDPNPGKALGSVLKRSAYVLLPLSVLFIKYFPEYGRAFSFWTGEAYSQGVTTHKNELGASSMMFALYYVWLLTAKRKEVSWERPSEERVKSAGMLALSLWLLYMAQSSTALVSLTVGGATLVSLASGVLKPRFLGFAIITTIAMGLGVELAFNASEQIILALGEDPTLTDRTLIWARVLSLVENPIFGTGFESFWLGARRDAIAETWRINQAHNGYLETYLNLGAVGVILLVSTIVASYRNIRSQLIAGSDLAPLKLGFLFAIVVFNYAEASFKAVHPLWTLFYVIAIMPKSAFRRDPRRYVSVTLKARASACNKKGSRR